MQTLMKCHIAGIISRSSLFVKLPIYGYNVKIHYKAMVFLITQLSIYEKLKQHNVHIPLCDFSNLEFGSLYIIANGKTSRQG